MGDEQWVGLSRTGADALDVKRIADERGISALDITRVGQ